MFDFSLFSINSMGLRYGASKLFQILIPLLSYLIIRDFFIQELLLKTPWVQEKLQHLSQQKILQPFFKNFPHILEQTLGFMGWKIGCDLGFFLIVTGLGPWSRAFTWAGLIPYTLIQYLIYYLVGRRMVVDGCLNPFQSQPKPYQPPDRPPLWKRIVAKYFHEDMNVTRDSVPLRQVILKPVVDYFGLVLSWSLYTVGLFFIQSGEVNWMPVVQFSFFQMFTFYLVNTYGYILGFNLGEILYQRLVELQEIWAKWRRGQTDRPNLPPSESLTTRWQAWSGFDRLQGIIQRYGLTGQWVFSAAGGVLCIMLLAPNFANVMLSLGNRVEHMWFQSQGSMDVAQTLQIEQAIQDDRPLAQVDHVIDQFPKLWAKLYLE